MKHAVVGIVLFTFLTIRLVAQDENKNFKHEVGFNTNVILNGVLNTGGGHYDLIYKHQVNPTKYNRFGIKFSLNVDNTNVNYSSGFISFAPTLGREWQKSISKKWVWYFGADISPSFSLRHSNNYQSGNPAANQTIQDNYMYGLALFPFMAIRFNISDRLYLATETAINFSYTLSRSVSTQTINGKSQNSDYYRDNYNVGSSYPSGISVVYKF
jgi:hypothetical protein